MISLKAYGVGPLQLPTDKGHKLFPRLEREGKVIEDKRTIDSIFGDADFLNVASINTLSLIYDKKVQSSNIMVFNHTKARQKTAKIILEEPLETGNRKHKVYKFYGENGSYICEVRYGGASANALQRGLWTNTVRGSDYFDSVTGNWIGYSHNQILVKLFSHALVASDCGHNEALEKIKKNILTLKNDSGI